MLFGVSVMDPAAIVIAASTLGVVAAIAGFVPARRASRVDPMVALRCD
jgi:ABC-type antimicrobial peptide transport system permease subunit